MNKKTIIILIMLIIIIGIICGIAFSKNSSKNVSTNTQKQEENTIVNEEINNNTNKIVENVIDENNIVENTQITTTSPEEEQGKSKTDNEKAIEIVEKDWGTQVDGIKFNVEGVDSKGRIVVVVRNTETTQALQFYYVDITNKTFVKE